MNGENWISLAVLTENPRCGLTVVFKQDGNWDLVGTCFEKHSHIEAVEQLISDKTHRVRFNNEMR